MSAPFRRLVVAGMGLLGGSVAWAARRRGVAERVVGLTRSRETAARAVSAGVVDEASVDPRAAATGADLVVLATPIFALADTLRRMAPSLAPGAIVTDVGSVKAQPAELLPGLLPPGVVWVGSHPMAGSHETGLAHARADLFEGAACVVTPGPGADAAAVARIEAFWRALGGRVLRRDPEAHDAEVAWTSHVPHAVAFAFARALAEAPPGAPELRGGGFRDFTRIAASDPELWADILVTNRKALAGPLQRTAERLAELARAVDAADADAVHRFLAAARDALAAVADEARSGGPNPEIPAAPEAAPKE